MIPGLGKQSLTIGSAAHCDIQLEGEGVAAEHARVTHRGGGQLVLTDLGAGPTRAGGEEMAPRSERPFDFRTQFHVGSVLVPLTHPGFGLMLMEKGSLSPHPGQITIGRDPARVHLVVHHPNISGRHATLEREPRTITDHGSTSGTWIGQRKLPPETPEAVVPGAIVALGPVPLTAHLIEQLLNPLQPAPTAMAASVAPADGGPREPRPRQHKTIVGQVSLGIQASQSQSIGRTPDNDIPIEHPQVSSKHAVLHRIAGKLFIEDLGSANGTYVRGQRIPAGQKIAVSGDEKVFIGPMPLRLQAAAHEIEVVVDDTEAWAGRPQYEIDAIDLVLQVPDRDNPNELKTLLDHISFKALPGDFIALMGPSGAGKTTLLLTLNGYLPPTEGQVLINGEDLHSIYDALRGSIGYVPQDDIVHPELTVWEAVRYSARMRLPPDYANDEIDRRVQTTLVQLGLDNVKHLQIGRPENKILSGGQRKRVNIAMELVTDPIIMFLDEPTSGLAADDTTALVDLLQGLAKETGKTIIATIHQPAKDEFEKFNLALILGQGGVPLFYGPTEPDAYRFFGNWLTQQGRTNDIDNPRDMFDMLKQREDADLQALRVGDPNATRFLARASAVQGWHREFFQSGNPTFQKMFSGRRQVGTPATQTGVPSGRPPTKGQFWLLFGRYLRIKSRDVSGTAIMLLQAPIIGVLLAMVFGWQKEAIPYWCLGALQELAKRFGDLGDDTQDLLSSMPATSDHAGAIFFLVVASVWFGTSNAAREIVSERGIYLRERMVNLSLLNYVFSKFLLLTFITLIQCTVLLAIVFFALGFNSGISGFLISLGTLVTTAMNSVAVGLLLSTLVVSAEAAMALTPIALIPQVVLGGLMVPMTTNELLKWPMYLMPARWGFQGVVAQERVAIANDPAWIMDLQRSDTSPDNFLVSGKFRCAEAQIASDSLNGAWGFVHFDQYYLPVAVLAAMMFVTLVAILIILRRRDRI